MAGKLLDPGAGRLGHAMSKVIDIESQLEHDSRPSAIDTAASVPLRKFSKRLPELDGYRGIAIATAVYYHYIQYPLQVPPSSLLARFNDATRPVLAGLEMFFILSGFLIGGILLDARSSPNYFKTFYVRRFCRILPIYLLFLGIVAVAYRVVPWWPYPSPSYSFFWGNMPWYSYLTFTQNFWMAKWNTLGPSILSITWSLAVEEQFYLLLPVIVRLVRREALPFVFVSGIVLAPFVRLFLGYHFRGNLYVTYTLLPCRMDSFCLGALCAYFVRQQDKWDWLVANRKAVWIAALALVAGMPMLNQPGIPFTGLWLFVGQSWMSVFFTLLMILVLTKPEGRLGAVMRWKGFLELGEVGYGVYLYHLAIYCAVVVSLTRHGWTLATWKDFAATVLAFAVTMGLAKLSWRYFEKPIIRWGHSWQY